MSRERDAAKPEMPWTKNLMRAARSPAPAQALGSASTIMRTSSTKLTGRLPASVARALAGSPIRVSTSAGRIKLGSSWTTSESNPRERRRAESSRTL